MELLGASSCPSQTDVNVLQTRQEPMRLNYDILFVIQGFLQDLPNTSRLMRTCWTLYDAGVPRLLRLLKGRVSISKYYNLVSFCVFMLRRRHNRFQYLVELDISLDRDIHPVNQDPRITNVITRMFKNASQLARLRLSHPYSPIATEEISSAIASLSSLHTITINDMCAEALPILNKMKSPIRKAKISFDPDWAEDGGDPVPLLQSLSDSLQYLDVSWVSFEALNVEYPHVVTLEAEFCRSVDFESLYSAFPNLRFLFLHSVQDDEWEMWADEHRGRNILAQADLGT
ncbi:hypothetical protein PHLGIDRAFT_120432 [Phlebiopsis gigantea 11061_1 CR5-6]|uniref:F-box domain-containing protein n=1 Tax=Phlebiopsis gigantea (strain 11061_1 CR5-6) TaxID=745531 RepID=A0A0C3S7J6_PHLG1|nr:hypothetical protein PHLGIDRAFT_120432 [Phlebiopsis gigantea 11061_1 CR5-6]